MTLSLRGVDFWNCFPTGLAWYPPTPWSVRASADQPNRSCCPLGRSMHHRPSDSETPSPQRHIITAPSSPFLSSLELSDTNVFDPQIRARLETTPPFSHAVSSRYRHGLSNPELDQLHENVTLVESLVSRPPVRPSTLDSSTSNWVRQLEPLIRGIDLWSWTSSTRTSRSSSPSSRARRSAPPP